jgi:hypothetical protein
MRDNQKYLASEVKHHWREDPATFRFVRVRLISDSPPVAPPPPAYGTGMRIVGYAILDPTKRDTENRRIFFVRDGDTDYPLNTCPCEAVDPLTLAPGIVGKVTERAWGGPLPK